MLPAPDTILECPHCKAHARKANLLSGNTFGSHLWSDGYMHAPMLPEMVSVTRCPNCRRIFWLADAEEVGDVPEPRFEEREVEIKRKWWFGTKKQKQRRSWLSPLSDLPELKHLDAKGLNEALNDLRSNPDRGREEYLRTRLWWHYNDRFRTEPKVTVRPQEEIDNRKNLEALLPLVDASSDQGRLKSASILLALDRFGDAGAIAEEVSDERLAPFKSRFIEAAEGQRHRVFQLR